MKHPFTTHTRIDRVTPAIDRREKGEYRFDTVCERVMALHGDCEGGVGTKEMILKLVWPYDIVCFGCEDVGAFFSRPKGKFSRKMNEQLVKEIRERAKNGELHKNISAEFGISQTYISKIVNNKSWVTR